MAHFIRSSFLGRGNHANRATFNGCLGDLPARPSNSGDISMNAERFRLTPAGGLRLRHLPWSRGPQRHSGKLAPMDATVVAGRIGLSYYTIALRNFSTPYRTLGMALDH